MMEIVLIRHAATDWNEKGLYQGRSDIPLSPAGCLEVRQWKLLDPWKNYKIFVSPLKRATQTAQILFPDSALKLDSRLIEMDFGQWEGASVEKLKKSQDFSPPSYGWKGWASGPPEGESYQQVIERFLNWVQESYVPGHNLVAITHKGVILSALAKAHGWDMTSKRPFKVAPKSAQILVYSPANGLEVKSLNHLL